ncbi:MAG: TraR/DksA family transcriptional regulator [Desulfuromonadales bacterium]|nr:TraR/DksA family transcriptional regulator [Desulfuromonadales bacterium]
MDAQGLAAAKDVLERLRQEVLREVRATGDASRQLDADDVPDLGDMSTRSYDRDVLYNLSEVQRQKIRDIDTALELLEQGDYGICVRCGDEIAPKRLEVRPFSRYCIECKTEVERFGE